MRVLFTLNLLILLVTPLTRGQSLCGTESTTRFLELLSDHRQHIAMHTLTTTRSIKQYPVSVYFMRQSDGSGGISLNEFEIVFDQLNDALAPAGIVLAICDTIHYIDSDTFYDFSKVQESSLTHQYFVDQTMNLYFPNSVITGAGNTLCGYAYFPGWQDVVIVDRHCALDGSSLIHEVGHYFGLLHTHGISNVASTDELADYSNCLAAGDDVCDTPAQPNLEATVDSSCNYYGTALDNNGMPFDPDPFNIMSYAPKQCRTILSEGQYQRMSYVATYLRDYLYCPVLSADFVVADPIAFCTDSYTTSLYYTGIGAVAFAWDVNNDGITDYDTSTITHLFDGPGSHPVCLTVSNGLDTITNCVEAAVDIMDIEALPFTTDFEVDNPGTMINPDQHHGWTVADLGPNYGSNSLVIDNYHYNAVDQEDYYVIGPFDMNTIPVPVLAYDLAYAPFSADRWDALRIEVSTDCGQTYEELMYDSGLSLSTTGTYSGVQWMPSDSTQWRLEQISLSAYITDTVLIRFANITGFGNNLYIDNISVQQDPLLAFEFVTFEVFPDAQGGHVLVWQTADEHQVMQYEIEISHDGLHFNTLDIVGAEGKLHHAYRYTNNSAPDIAYYRIRGKLGDGGSTLSTIRYIKTQQRTTAVFPNPVTDLLHVRLDWNGVPIYLYDASGRRIRMQVINRNAEVTILDVTDLTAGVYTVVNGDFTARFVKMN